ncbi:MAG: hypothetical protein LBG68_04255, partial [Coriobacteriales bacterium]|nr:hypothetical protein [Coriobacteriales bacterium]
WFEPVLETLIGGELPGEIESLFFCIQTGIGVGIIAYSFGYLVARKRFGGNAAGNLANSNKAGNKAGNKASKADSKAGKANQASKVTSS